VQIVNVSAKQWGSAIDQEFKRVSEAIFNGTFTGDIDPAMVKAIAQKLHLSAEEAMKEFYKGTNLKFNPELGAKLERNAYNFAASKNYKQLAFLKAMKESGVPKEKFLEDAAKQNTKFNHTWLQTEENYAKGAAQSAARWDSFGENSWLKYRTSNDERVRNEHRLLNGIIKPIQDPFWDTYYPPNGYNCRCLAIETSSREETDLTGKPVPEVDQFFQNNVGKQEVLFPGNHPYFKNQPLHVPRLGVLNMPDSSVFVKKETDFGTYLEHLLCQEEPEVLSNRKHVEILLKLGYDGEKISLLPRIYHTEVELRKRYYGEVFQSIEKNKCPDCATEFGLLEFKKIHGLRNFDKSIKDAAKKSSIALIEIEIPVDFDKIELLAKKYLESTDLKGIIIVNNEKYYPFGSTKAKP
jgi:SPP1 gp7 family putative phage head morphogenesis protein